MRPLRVRLCGCCPIAVLCGAVGAPVVSPRGFGGPGEVSLSVMVRRLRMNEWSRPSFERAGAGQEQHPHQTTQEPETTQDTNYLAHTAI